MGFYLLVAAIIFCMFMSIRALFAPSDMTNQKISLNDLLWLAFLYGTICVGFGALYLLFELKDITVVLENGQRLQGSFSYKLESTLYFSGMTMFSVGYGDLVPIGIGRPISAIQAFIGYTLPAAFVVRTVIDYDQIQK
ncbi:ion channel [Peribacillus acanthi]|uniref:ion channel n=1 Tax=Peribacillus acanthi TaxID=2171554 RepID=UPI000D3E6033|nr:ion channel [Peribacillus acanthi]